MRETERLLDQLNRAFGGEAWHGPALRNLLDGVTEEQARKHPIPNAHSIFELVVHVGTCMDEVARRIISSEVVLTTTEDWADVGDRSWSAAIEELEHAESRLCDAVARLSTERLDEKVPGKEQSIYHDVAGALQHSAYHGGQITLLKKMLGETL